MKIRPAIRNEYSALLEAEPTAKAITEALESSGLFPIQGGELSIVFVDDETIAGIHGRFMADPSPTDVITFPADTEMDSAGEIIISVDHARYRATELKEPFSRELTLYLVHGWLHLAGYDDRGPEMREEMRKAEKQALQLLDTQGASSNFSLKENSGALA